MELSTQRLMQWNDLRWPNFSPHELSCRHCGEIYLWPQFLDNLQALRERIGRPLVILSGHRCAHHNARVGGAPLSQHLKLAVDIDLSAHDPLDLARNARDSGFTGFGFYNSFLHLDMGRQRHWFGGPKARTLWKLL